MSKKLSSLMTFSIVCALNCSLFGVTEMKVRSLENRVAKIEKNQKYLEGQVQPYGVAETPNETGGFLEAEMLYWYAREDGLGFTVKGYQDIDGLTLLPNEIEEMTWDWNFGVRVNLGLKTDYDKWDMVATWTYYKTHAQKLVESPSISTDAGSKFYLLTWSTELGDDQANHVQSNWQRYLNFLDFNFARSCWVSKTLMLRPHFGPRAARTNMDFDIFSTTDFADDDLSLVDDVKYSQDTWGIGMMTGMDSHWFFARNWGMFAKTNIGLLYGGNSIRKKHQLFTTSEGDYNEVKLVQHFHSAIPIVDLEAGLKWQQWFRNDKIGFSIHASWDTQVWFSLNKLPKIVNHNFLGTYVPSNGNFIMSGLCAGARLDF